MQGLEWTFDTVVEDYEKFRPGYAIDLYDTIFDYVNIDKDSSVLEIGSGAGQATAPILDKGCHLTAVEYGSLFCKLLSKKFAKFDNFSVLNGKFEDIHLEENSFDLIFSATAFHWIPEKEGYEKVFKLLKKGGVFARFANHPYRDKTNPLLADEIDEIYEEYYNKYHQKKRAKLVEFNANQAATLANIASKYGFTDVEYHIYKRARTFTAEEYIRLLGTYSDHIAIEEKTRTEFFNKIKNAINNHGGTITIYDTMDLELARKS